MRPFFRLHFCVVVFGLLLPLSGALAQSEAPALDHVRVLVHDIAAAQGAFHALGFEMRRPEASVYQEGSAHNSAPLQDGTYLELIGVADRDKLLKSRPWIVDFLEHSQGAHSVGVIVTSAQAVADRLQSRKIDAPLFKLAASQPGAKPILLITPKLASLPEGTIFFVEYPWQRSSGTSRTQFVQPNTALGTIAVWILVKDLEAASKDGEILGFQPGRLLDFKALGARGREFQTGNGSLLLLEPTSPNKPAADFSRERGAGVMGVTLAVGELGKAKSMIEEKTHKELPPYDGVYGRSFLVPAEVANGVWIEMTQK